MTARLPIPGSDDGTWGSVLNDYLSQSLDSSGNLNANIVGASQVADGALPQAKIQNLTTSLSNKVNTTSVGAANGVASLDAGSKVPIAQMPAVSTGGYPLSEYGFFSAAAAIENFTANSTILSLFIARIFVPAGQAINAVATVVTNAGTLGAGGGNCFVVYESDGSMAGSTPVDDTLWQTAGMKIGIFSTPIAAQASNRFVFASPFVVGYSAAPNIAYCVVNHPALLTGGYNKPNHRRAFYASGVSSLPASINPATYGTESNYLPFVALG